MTTFLDCVKHSSHVHQKTFVCPVFLPDGKVQRSILLDVGLDLHVSHFGDFVLDLVFLRHVGNRWQLA